MRKNIKNIPFVIILCVLSFAAGLVIRPKNKENKTNTTFTSPTPQTQIRIENSEDIGRELSEIKDELSKIRAEQRSINQVLGAFSSGSITDFAQALEDIRNNPITQENQPQGYVKANTEKYQTVDIYEAPSFSSTTIVLMDKYKSYPYFEKKDNWYKIEVSSGKTGYVNAKFVIEETIKSLQ